METFREQFWVALMNVLDMIDEGTPLGLSEVAFIIFGGWRYPINMVDYASLPNKKILAILLLRESMDLFLDSCWTKENITCQISLVVPLKLLQAQICRVNPQWRKSVLRSGGGMIAIWRWDFSREFSHDFLHARTYVGTRTYVRTHTHVRMHTYTHARARTHTHTHARTHTHTHTHTHTRARRKIEKWVCLVLFQC